MLKCFSNVRYKYFFFLQFSVNRDRVVFLQYTHFFLTEQGLSSSLCLQSLSILGVLLSDDT